MLRGRFNIVVGAQAGSEAKGKFSAFLARKFEPSALFMAASPNAGHTYVDDEGVKWVTYHLPAAIHSTDCPVYLGPSSVINPSLLLSEVTLCGIDPSRIFIDPRAISITPMMLEGERFVGLSDIGSTLQGVGVARISKISRPPSLTFLYDLFTGKDAKFANPGFRFESSSPSLSSILRSFGTVLAEMTQGFDLDLEHGIHPRYCTSKMINPSMCMAEAGINPHLLGHVYGVLRPYPIRVNNRTGTSGPYAEAQEITWDAVKEGCGAPVSLNELTTTTKLPRRVFTFSWNRFRRFVETCGPDHLCLQFSNYIDWMDYGKQDWSEISDRTKSFISELEREAGCRVSYVGTGPQDSHMVDRLID